MLSSPNGGGGLLRSGCVDLSAAANKVARKQLRVTSGERPAHFKLKHRTMTPKEKAKKLVEKYNTYAHSDWHEVYGFNDSQRLFNAKQCALIAVEECIKEVNQNFTSDRYAYWNEVKTEIENL